MKIVEDNPSALTALDRPNSYIGRSVPRPNLTRLTEGRGQYVSDVTLPRMAHVAYVRSPHAHARIVSIDTAAAKKAAGVIAVVTGPELAKVITPWVGVLTHLKGIKSAPQYAIAVDRACWQGEAVCAVVAKTRAQAEDACELVEVKYEELPAVTDAETALDTGNAGDPSRARRQSHLRAQARGGRTRQGVCRSRRSDRGDIPVRPSYRRVQRAARDRRRLESRRAAADRISWHAGAAHDAEPVRQASRAGRTAGARRHQGRRRLVRHQGAHLCGRDGDGGAVEAAAAAR